MAGDGHLYSGFDHLPMTHEAILTHLRRNHIKLPLVYTTTPHPIRGVKQAKGSARCRLRGCTESHSYGCYK